MPLTTAAYPRTRAHQRRVSYEGYFREDGLLDIEGHLTDRKDADYKLSSGMRSKDIPVHEMRVRVTIDLQFNVHAIEAVTEQMPYPGYCSTIGPEYKALVGANLMKGFRKAIANAMGGVKGCTHLSEMLSALPTAAVQTIAGKVNESRSSNGQKPFQLDSCHALATSGEAVRLYYPAWYAPKPPLSETQNHALENAVAGIAVDPAATTLSSS